MKAGSAEGMNVKELVRIENGEIRVTIIIDEHIFYPTHSINKNGLNCVYNDLFTEFQ